MKHKFTIYAMGQDTVTAEFDGVKPIQLKRIAAQLKRFFDREVDVLALNQSLTLFEKNCAALLDELHTFLSTLELEEVLKPKCWELPVKYDGIDLDVLSEKLKRHQRRLSHCTSRRHTRSKDSDFCQGSFISDHFQRRFKFRVKVLLR